MRIAQAGVIVIYFSIVYVTIPPSVHSQDAPVVEFDKTSHDFGDIYDAGVYTSEFIYRNTGGKTLVFKKIKRSCNCMYEIPTKSELEPGESGTITVGYDLRDRPIGYNAPEGTPSEYNGRTKRWGRRSDYIAIETNDPATPMVMLKIWIDYKPPVEVVPDRITFDHTSPGEPISSEFSVLTVSSPDQRPSLTFDVPNEHATVTLQGLRHDGVKWVSDYRIAFDSNQFLSHKQSLLVHTGHNRIPVIELPMEFQSRITSPPSRAMFGVVKATETKTIELEISYSGGKSLSTSCPDDRVEVKVEKTSDPARWLLFVTFSPNGDTRRLNSSVVLQDAEKSFVGEIKVLGIVKH